MNASGTMLLVFLLVAALVASVNAQALFSCAEVVHQTDEAGQEGQSETGDKEKEEEPEC